MQVLCTSPSNLHILKKIKSFDREKSPNLHILKLHHRRPQTVAQISHEILETSPEHGHTRPAGKQDGTKDRAGRRAEKANTASQTRWETSWETRPETRERQAQGGQTQHPR